LSVRARPRPMTRVRARSTRRTTSPTRC
jgi:hypothetical protein